MFDRATIFGLFSAFIFMSVAVFQNFDSNPSPNNCNEYVVKSSAKSYFNKEYGLGCSAAGGTFEPGDVTQNGNTYYVTVYCDALNPVDFTYECTDSGLQLVSVEL
tara:strand:- start:317 stop:631 length:315 start_codon:yes stop_codon:yes gene_type:complete